MGRLVIVAGTDTGIGKTWVSCRIGEALYAHGVDARGVKLVETGTPIEPSPDEDGVLLARATRQAFPVAALRRYRTPVAAAEAADREGVPLDLSKVEAEVLAIAEAAELTLVEGAGGLFAPLTWKRNLLDVARRHGAPVLVVGADRLGTINHTLLTLAMLDLSGCTCLGVVLNRLPGTPSDDVSVGTNLRQLQRLRPDLPMAETAVEGWVETVVGWVRSGR
ncbi:MAG TPA: dethiobiotin synthase [Gemmatimonadales bacterium]|nr:dethiobiotin synthase [Gemmatimonadales bacterium]